LNVMPELAFMPPAALMGQSGLVGAGSSGG
jgi:hypothetical protein